MGGWAPSSILDSELASRYKLSAGGWHVLLCSPAVHLCCCDRDPRSESLSNKVHGRADACFTAVRVVLTFVFSLDVHFRTTFLVIGACGGSVAVLYGYLTCPYYHQRVNFGYVAGSAVLCTTAALLALLEIRQSPQVRFHSRGVLLCTPYCSCCGA